MRTILVTGASDGIGRALAAEFAGRGERVLGVGRRMFEPAMEGGVAPEDYYGVDLADAQAPALIDSFLDERGVTRLDVLVHNAAVGFYGPPAQQEPASIDLLLAVNLQAPIQLTHRLLRRVRAAQGVVAFVSSVHSALPTPEFAVYTATKAALDGFARSLRAEERGALDVIVLWPGPTRTQMHAKSGVPPAQLRPLAYPPPEQVAAQAAEAIARRRSQALGGRNRLLRAAAVHGEALVDSLLRTLAHRRRGAGGAAGIGGAP